MRYSDNSSLQEDEILAIVKSNPGVRRAEIASRLGWSLNVVGATLQRLRELMLISVGSNNGWYPFVRPRRIKRIGDSILSFIVEHPGATTATIAAGLKLSREYVNSALNRLLRKRRIECAGYGFQLPDNDKTKGRIARKVLDFIGGCGKPMVEIMAYLKINRPYCARLLSDMRRRGLLKVALTMDRRRLWWASRKRRKRNGENILAKPYCKT